MLRAGLGTFCGGPSIQKRLRGFKDAILSGGYSILGFLILPCDSVAKLNLVEDFEGIRSCFTRVPFDSINCNCNY